MLFVVVVVVGVVVHKVCRVCNLGLDVNSTESKTSIYTVLVTVKRSVLPQKSTAVNRHGTYGGPGSCNISLFVHRTDLAALTALSCLAVLPHPECENE